MTWHYDDLQPILASVSVRRRKQALRLAWLFAGLTISSSAATCVQPLCVNRIDDSVTAPVNGMLRYAVQNAPPGATISFDPALSGLALTLDGSLPNNHIKIVQDVMIQGPGANLLTISGGNATRIFFIAGGNVSISGLTLANGFAKGGNGGGGGGGAAGMGGAIFLNGGSLTLSGVVLRGNVAQGGSSVAGAGSGGGGFGGDASGSSAGPSGDLPGGSGGQGGFSAMSSCSPGGNGGFGGGGGAGASSHAVSPPVVCGGGLGGFGGGGGAGANGGFGGGAGGAGGGGGAAFGGGIFARSGTLQLANTAFTNNSTAGGTGANNGQAKGGGLFICSSSSCGSGYEASVILSGTTSFQGDVATDAGANKTCPGHDDADVCGYITASTPTHFSVTTPSLVTAGVPFSFTITALDSNNNIVFTYGGLVHFTSTDPAAVLPPDATLTNGTGTFTATLKTGGPETITATDRAATAITGASPPIKLSFGGTLGPVSVIPNSGGAVVQTFAFSFYDPFGWEDLSVVNILINNLLDGRHACYLAYVISPAALFLVDDAGDAGGPFAGSQNSQCAVNLVSAVGNGAVLTLTLNVMFKSSFGGNKIVYMAAGDSAQHNSGWETLGVWQAPFTPSGTIAVSSANPANGAGASGTPQKFAFTLTDSKGAGDLGIVNVLINNAIDGRQACYLAYVEASNVLYLVDDAGDAGGPFAGGAVLNGAGGPIQNGQCVVSAVVSSAMSMGNALTLTLDIVFKAAFIGNRVVYVAGRDNAAINNTDWQAVGIWTVQ